VERGAVRELECGHGEEIAVTKEEVLAKRKADWLKQARRDFIDAYTEQWESEGWIEEWEAQEQELRDQWHGQHPDGSEEDWDEWLNRQMIVWHVEECIKKSGSGSQQSSFLYLKIWIPMAERSS
jgi:hypothetical protein